MKRVLLFVGIWFIVLNLFAVLVANRLNLAPDTAYRWIDPIATEQQQTVDVVRLHSRWDSFWLLSVANEGYHDADAGSTLSNVVFFPLYPAVTRFVTMVVGGDFLLGGWVVSTLFLVLAALLLARLVEEFHPQVRPLHAVAFLLLFPTAFFLNAVYSESTFLFFALGTFLFAFRKRFWVAALFALGASLTRITGLLLFLPLAWEVGRTFLRRQASWHTLLTPLIPLAGVGAFFLYHYLRFGNFLLFFDVQSAWGRAFTLNADHFSTFSPAATANLILDGAFILLALVATVAAWRKGWHAYALFMAAVVLSALATGTLMSINRYVLLLFPIPILAASLRSQEARFGWALASTLLLGLYTSLFVNWYWAG